MLETSNLERKEIRCLSGIGAYVCGRLKPLGETPGNLFSRSHALDGLNTM